MKKNYIFSLVIFLSFIVLQSGFSQTVIINTGVAGTPAYNAGPIYRSSAASAYDASRYTYLYTAAELSAAGITTGSVINLVGWVKNNTTTTTGGGIFRIFMKNTATASFSNATEPWANLNTGATLVYENLNQNIPATAAPDYIDFALNTPFTYTGGSLEISTEWDINQVAGSPTTGTFQWMWSTVVDRIYGTGQTVLANAGTLSSTTNSISTIDDRRPFIKISFSGGVVGVDMSATDLVAPTVANCYSAVQPVSVRIRNNSSGAIDFSVNPVTVTVNVTGAVNTSLVVVLNTGTLAGFATQDVSMGTLNMSTVGTYTFNGNTSVAGDINTANDAMPAESITAVAVASGNITASPSSYCVNGGTPTLTLAGSAGGNIQWQESTVGAGGPWTNVGTNSTTYTPATAITSTTYYRATVSCNANSSTTSVVTVSITNPQVLTTTGGATCGPGTVTLAATGSAGTTLNWFQNATGGTALSTGPSFTTPVINNTTTYYVSANVGGGGSTNVGLPAKLAATSGFGTTNFGLVFDAISAFTLNTVDLYPIAAAPNTPGTVTIDVINSTGAIVHTATVNVIGNPVATATANTVTLNFNIAPGTNYKIRPGSRSASITALLFEPSATAPGGNYGYPFVVPGVLSINHSTLTAAPTNTPRLDLYYYFYNWSVGSGCASARTAVVATVDPVPGATIAYPSSPYCGTGTAAVTRTGTAGGTYSSTAGLSIDAATGTVNLTTSTAGTYTVTYTIPASGACAQFTTTAPITINSFSVAPTAANSSMTSLCGTGTTNLSVTGGSLAPGATWRWYSGSCGGTFVGTGATLNNVTVNATTTFYVRGEGICNNTACASVTVTVNTRPTAVLTLASYGAITPYTPASFNVTVSPTGNYTYQWYKNSFVVPGLTANRWNATVDDFGEYSVIVTDVATGCTTLTNRVTLSDLASTTLFIYPNPSSGTFMVRYHSPNSTSLVRTLNVYDARGARVYTSAYNISRSYDRMEVNLDHAAPGVYLVELTDAAGTRIESGKVVIKR